MYFFFERFFHSVDLGFEFLAVDPAVFLKTMYIFFVDYLLLIHSLRLNILYIPSTIVNFSRFENVSSVNIVLFFFC